MAVVSEVVDLMEADNCREYIKSRLTNGAYCVFISLENYYNSSKSAGLNPLLFSNMNLLLNDVCMARDAHTELYDYICDSLPKYHAGSMDFKSQYVPLPICTECWVTPPRTVMIAPTFMVYLPERGREFTDDELEQRALYNISRIHQTLLEGRTDIYNPKLIEPLKEQCFDINKSRLAPGAEIMVVLEQYNYPEYADRLVTAIANMFSDHAGNLTFLYSGTAEYQPSSLFIPAAAADL